MLIRYSGVKLKKLNLLVQIAIALFMKYIYNIDTQNFGF